MIELSLLGSPELRRSGETSAAILVQPRRLALLAYLATSRGTYQRRDRLLLLFWGDQPESRARASLRQALYFIRKALGDDALITRGDEEVGLNFDVAHVDVRTVELAIAGRRDADALALYRGDFLADFNVANAPEFERWASERRRELRRAILDAAWRLAETSRGPDAVRWSWRALELAEYADGDVRRAMEVMTAAGDRAAALEAQRMATGSDIPPVDIAPQPPVESITPSLPSSRQSSRKLGIAAAVLAIVAAGWMLAQRTVSATPVDANVASRVAVFPFTVHSPAGQVGYLHDGTATLLALALDGAGRLRVVDPNAVLSASPATPDLPSAKRIASTLNAGQFVLGEINEAGPRLNVSATLYDQSGRVLGRATAAGDDSRVFDMVDSLARHLAISAMPDSSARLAGVASTSTRSLAAFKSFLAGETAMRAGHYREAVTALQDAVAADSTFGLAWYRLSLAREWTDGEFSSDSAAALAEHFAAHLPDRDRKLLAARRAFVRRDQVEAEKLANEVLALYPTDADAWAQLGEVRFHLSPNIGSGIDVAREPFLTVLRYRPNDLTARVHLTRIAARNGDTAHLDEWSGHDAWRMDPSEVGTFELAAMRSVLLNDVEARDSVSAALRRATARTVASTVWRLAIYAGDPIAADHIASMGRQNGIVSPADVMGSLSRGQLAQKPIDVNGSGAHAILLATLLALPSAPELPQLARSAQQELKQVMRSRPAVRDDRAAVAERVLAARYPDALAAPVRQQDLPASEERTVRAVIDAMHLLGSDPAQSLNRIVPANLDEPTLMRDALYDIVASIRGEAMHRLHRGEDAVLWLRSIGLNSLGSSAAIAIANRRLAAIEDARGNRAAAAPYRVRFINAWQSADPALQPLVEAARAAR